MSDDLPERVAQLERTIGKLQKASDAQWLACLQLVEDLFDRADTLGLTDQSVNMARAREDRAVARCLLAILGGGTEPLAFYLPPEV